MIHIQNDMFQEADIIDYAISLPLESKIPKSIATIQQYEHESIARNPRGYRVGDSFGKDSDCIVELCKMAGVKHFCEHNLTTLDAPELIYWGKHNRPETEIRKPAMSLLHMVAFVKTTLPTRTGRWCCELYKERKNGVVNIFGVRAAESRRRRRAWKVWTPHIKTHEWTLNPILYWSDADVWEFHKLRNIPHCPLYDGDCTRLGCIGCPMSGNRKAEFKRWPKYEKAWRWAITKFWERLHDAKTIRDPDAFYSWHKFKTPEDLWNWWMEEQPADDGCQMGLF